MPADQGPDISIIVPTRDREPLLRRLLAQLLLGLEPGPSYEVVVVDEGSSDATPALLDRLAADHPLRVLRHDVPVGLPAARNAGTRAATGRYLAWIDDDDLTSPDRLRRQFEALSASGLRWSCAARAEIDDDLEVVGHIRCPDPDGFLPALLRSNTLPGAAQGLLVERSLDDEVGGYDETLRSAEDWEYCIRLGAVAAPHFLDEPLVGYRTGVASMSTDTARMEDAIRAVYAKHAGLMAANDVTPDWARVHQSLVLADLRNSRRAAARRFVRLFRAEPTAKNVARGVAGLVSPSWFERQSVRRWHDQVPPAWRAQARLWLDALPSIEPADPAPPAQG